MMPTSVKETRTDMDTNITIERNDSNVWPYVIAGSAIGGALGYFLMTDSGRKVRRSIRHPEELSEEMEGLRRFIEDKATLVTNEVHGVLNKAKTGIEEGQAAYREAEQTYRMKVRQVEAKNAEVTANIHKAVDNMNQTALA